MKQNFTLAILIVFACALGFTSCKKDTFKTPVQKTSNADSNKIAASRYVVSFYKSLIGAYGGAEIKNGIKVSSVTPSAKKGPVLFSMDPLCGYKIDTTSDTTVPINDTTKYHYGGHFSFTYTCSASTPDGYTNDNNFFTSTRSTNTQDSIHFIQQFTVKALDNTYKLVSMDGYAEIIEWQQVFNGPYYSLGPNFSINRDIKVNSTVYNLHGIKVDVSNGVPDMISGTATFNDYYSIANKNNTNPDAFTDTYATITFLGNYLARITAGNAFNFGQPGSTYTFTINVLTGQVVN